MSKNLVYLISILIAAVCAVVGVFFANYLTTLKTGEPGSILALGNPTTSVTAVNTADFALNQNKLH